MREPKEETQTKHASIIKEKKEPGRAQLSSLFKKFQDFEQAAI